MLMQFLALLACSLGLLPADACTTMAAGSKATADGSVIVSHADDGDVLADPRLTYVPAMDHPVGAQRQIFYTEGPFPRRVASGFGAESEANRFTGPNITAPIGYIPQVRHTFSYHDANFGIINEHNVAFAESTCSAMFYTCGKGDTRHCTPGMDEGVALLNMETLSEIAMERATTAREAIQIIGDLAVEYGFFGTHDPNGDGEAAQIADSTEAWTFHILADPTGTSAIWAAVRVPDENVTVLANMFTIREVNVSDTANCMASANVYTVAQERGWWRPGEVLDFTKVYSNGEYAAKYYSGRRMWRGLSLMAPSLDLPAEYDDLRYDRMWPWSVKPDRLITPEDVMSLHRDYLQGTKFDLTKGLAAGYGGSPDRFDVDVPGRTVAGNWERSIALYRTNLVHVQHLRRESPELPRGLAGVAWYAAGPAAYSPFIPIPSGLTLTPGPLIDYSPEKSEQPRSWQSLNWAARRVMMVCQIRFDHAHPVVEREQRAAESLGRRALLRAGVPGTPAFDGVFDTLVRDVANTWKDLDRTLLFLFSDNTDIAASWAELSETDIPVTKNIAALGYPNDWLRGIGFTENSPPPPPYMDQCPPRCPSTSELKAVEALDAQAPEISVPRAEAPEINVKRASWLPTCLIALAAFTIGRASVASRRRPLAEDEPAAFYGRL